VERQDCVSVSAAFVAERLTMEEKVVRLQLELRSCRRWRQSGFILPAANLRLTSRPPLEPPAPHFLAAGFPPCRGGERGYWQPLVTPDQRMVRLAVTTIDFLDPQTVLCWVQAEQQIEVR
jgi:hypothetical protein